MKEQTIYSIGKNRRILREAILRYKKLRRRLDSQKVAELEIGIEELDKAITANDLPLATARAKFIQQFLKTIGKKNSWDHIRELFLAIAFAVIVAAFVRQMWFEPYEIPTGSMRPTFKEHDRVLVSKNAFGINTPFQTSHLNFNPHLLKHGSIIVWSGDGIDLPDVDTTYFLLFPGKRRYVKRCMGRPGDTLYFYGGYIYGIDKEGREIVSLHDDPSFSHIEHVPFLNFDGKISQVTNVEKRRTEFIFKQMNIPIAKLGISPLGKIATEVFTGLEWIRGAKIADLWGINNFAMARIIHPQDLPDEATTMGYGTKDAVLYLELKHSPMLPTKKLPSAEEQYYAGSSVLKTELSWVPLNSKALETLKNGLYTARFTVKGGYAQRYFHEASGDKSLGIYLADNIPDGTYEFFNGIAYSIDFADIATELPPNHPIYPTTPDLLKIFFNCGIDFNPLAAITTYNSELHGNSRPAFFPTRYAYFREGDFYAMGIPLLKKDETSLITFTKLEGDREDPEYIPFIDHGPPIKDGVIDQGRFEQYGLKIPEKGYLALGDNYANSLDSRFFGFVPQNNIQGSPIAILWPPGPRFGMPPQPDVPFFRIQNLYVLSAAALIFVFSVWLFHRSSSRRSYERTKRKGAKTQRGT